ncbi:hypothetical protein PINS_up006845 [Pythium insidiosum]|nr:hypothetical protein PINS_up006845 [Pythium insidiosum]
MRRSPRQRARDDESEASALSTATSTKRIKRDSSTSATATAATTTVHESDERLAWLAASPLSAAKTAEWRAFLGTHCALQAPSELFDLFALATHLNASDPRNAFATTLEIRLTGPFDLLRRSGTNVVKQKPLHLHGRFAMDVPEIVTVMEDTASATGAHWGLFRDAPKQVPSLVVHCADSSVCQFEPVATSLFAFLHHRATERLQSNDDNALAQLKHELQSYLERKNVPDAQLKATATRARRDREVTAKSLHGLGIVVPYDAKKRCGFRELPVAGTALRDLLSRSDASATRKKVSELITRATIANDECDFGTGLLLGLDLFTTGAAFQKEALQLLRVSYALLGRKPFVPIASDLVKHRDLDSRDAIDCLDSSTSALTSLSTPVSLP